MMQILIVSHMLSGTAEHNVRMQIFLDWCLTFTRSFEQKQRRGLPVTSRHYGLSLCQRP